MIRRIAVALTLLVVVGCSGDTQPATTAVVAIQGTSSSEAAVSEWFDGLAGSDPDRMWSTIDPDLRTGVRRPAWDACIAVESPERSDVTIDYVEVEVYTEDGSTYSAGSATIDGDVETVTLPVTFEVVERAGGWFTVGQVRDDDTESCLMRAAG